MDYSKARKENICVTLKWNFWKFGKVGWSVGKYFSFLFFIIFFNQAVKSTKFECIFHLFLNYRPNMTKKWILFDHTFLICFIWISCWEQQNFFFPWPHSRWMNHLLFSWMNTVIIVFIERLASMISVLLGLNTFWAFNHLRC